MKNFLVIVVGILVFNAVLLYSGGFDYIRNQFEPTPAPPLVNPSVVDTFRDTLEAEVRAQLGAPIEGYEPHMFLQVFPGLVETDFDGVEASIGKYVIRNGRLVHEMDNTQLVHSAAGAVSRRGIQTLYRNIAERIGIDIQNGGTLTDIMSAITAQ